MDYFEKYINLRKSLPRLALNIINTENCDYCNYIDRCKDCYLAVSVLESEKCLYGKHLFFSKFCVDSDYLEKCELLYQSDNCTNCYNGNYLQDCENCTDCEYCFYCKGCQDCFGCMNLRHKQYYIFNKPYKKEDYETKIKELKQKNQKFLKTEFKKVKLNYPHPAVIEENNEDSSGNHIFNNKNVQYCFYAHKSRDCAYCHEAYNSEDCLDMFVNDYCKWDYHCVSGYHLENSNFCYNCWESSDLEYCDQCFQCDNCFLCANLHHKKYYILNEPYEKEEYFRKKAKIITKMKEKGIYGNLPPSTYPKEDSLAA